MPRRRPSSGSFPSRPPLRSSGPRFRRASTSHALRSRTLVVGYPILPLLEQIGDRSPDVARHVHWGATTQDIMDTGLALLAGRAFDRIDVLVQAVGRRARGPGRRSSFHRDAGSNARTACRPDHLRRQAGRVARRADATSREAARRARTPSGGSALRRGRHRSSARNREPGDPARGRRAARARRRRRAVARGA